MKFSEEMIGGAYVMRAFNRGNERLHPGCAPLTREEVLAIPAANRNSLIDNGVLSLFPLNPATQNAGNLMIVSRGFGKHDVIRGTILNEGPLTKEEAEVLVASLTAPVASGEPSSPAGDTSTTDDASAHGGPTGNGEPVAA